MYSVIALICSLSGDCRIIVPDPPIPQAAFFASAAECVEGAKRTRELGSVNEDEWFVVSCVNWERHVQ